MSGRGRALRTGVAYDQRSGFKTRGRKLVSDGERPGIWTERSWADEVHPGRFINTPPPDGLNYRPGPPATHSIGAKVDLTWSVASDTSLAYTDSQFTQSPLVLRRTPLRPAFIDLRSAALVVGPVADGSMLWGGWELQWGGTDIVWLEDPDLPEGAAQWGGLGLSWNGTYINWLA